MIGLPYGEKNYDNILSHFHLIPEHHGQTERQMDGQTDRIAISISCVNVLMRDKNKINWRLRRAQATLLSLEHIKLDTSNLLCNLSVLASER